MRAERSARVFQRRNKPRHTKIAIIHRFWRQLCVISLRCKIFRRFSAVFTAFCVQDVVLNYSATSKQDHTHANRNRSSILTIIMRYFSPVWDISTFQRTSHCMQNAGHAFSIDEKALTHANSNRSTILTIIMRYFSPVWVISTFQRTSHCMQNVEHAFSIVETSPDTRK